MPDQQREIRKFLRAARQRLDTALFLLRHQFNLLDAMYLAGYAVECGLKALILKWTSKHEFTKVLADLTEVGRKGHEFEYLKGLIKIRMGKRGATAREAFARLAEYFGLVATWTPALRYESGNRDPEVARDMIKAAQNIYEWCERG